MSASRPTLDIKQAAEYLKIHPNTLQERAKHGSIPGAAKVGKSWVFLEEGLREYLLSLSPCPWPGHGSHGLRGLTAAPPSGRNYESVIDREIRLRKEARKRRGR